MSMRSLSLLVPALALVAGCVQPAAPAATPATVAAAPSGAAPSAEASPAPAAQPAEALPPMPPWKHGENIFAGAKLAWVDPYSPAHLKSIMAVKHDHDPALAALYAKIAENGGAEWIGDWTAYVGRYVGKRADMILKSGVLPYFVVYNIPKRDCGQYSAGGAEAGDKYKQWISEFAKGLGNRRAAEQPGLEATYVTGTQSLAFPELPMAEVNRLLQIGLTRGQMEAVKAMRDWCRGRQ